MFIPGDHPQLPQDVPEIREQSAELKLEDKSAREAAPNKHDTVRIEQDFEHALSAVPPPQDLHRVEETEEMQDAMRRVSIDSASSYGSIGFSHSSTSSLEAACSEPHS